MQCIEDASRKVSLALVKLQYITVSAASLFSTLIEGLGREMSKYFSKENCRHPSLNIHK